MVSPRLLVLLLFPAESARRVRARADQAAGSTAARISPGQELGDFGVRQIASAHSAGRPPNPTAQLARSSGRPALRSPQAL